MIEFYKSYFERLATRNKHIGHTADVPAFFYIKDKYNPKAFDDALRSEGKTPALILEKPAYDLTDNSNRNRFKHINGRFSIVISTVAGDQSSIDAAEVLADQIALSIIAKMSEDFDAGGFITLNSGEKQKVFFKITDVPVDPIGPMLQKYYGVTVGFTWNCPLAVSSSPGDWLDNE